jgi:hypothetical protein
MPNRFFEEEDIRPDTDTQWRGKVAEELRRRNPFGDLYAAAVYSTPEIYLYHKDHFRPYGAKLVLQMGEEGLGIGFYVERGYVWAAEAGWTLQPHWDWHHFLYLMSNDPGFLSLFQKARGAFPDFSFWIQSGEADTEELSLHASHLPIAALLGLLNGWPGNLWCDLYFSSHIPGQLLLSADDESVMQQIIKVIAAAEPLYRAVLNRKIEVDARSSSFSA